MDRFVSLSLLVTAVVVAMVAAQDPIPRRPPRGFQYLESRCDSPVEMKAFLDLTCPDCKQAWPVLQQVAAYYNYDQGGKKLLDFEVLLFPLPYHRAAFPAAWASYIARNEEYPKVYTWFDAIFRHQSKFYNNAIFLKNESILHDMLAEEVFTNTGIPKESIMSGFKETDPSLEETIVMWKYACTRGVSGTPTVFVNGIRVDFELTWTLADWRKVIDPLLTAPQRAVRTCPSDLVTCRYLPGKTECCTKGEACIPNVGCRC